LEKASHSGKGDGGKEVGEIEMKDDSLVSVRFRVGFDGVMPPESVCGVVERDVVDEGVKEFFLRDFQ